MPRLGDRELGVRYLLFNEGDVAPALGRWIARPQTKKPRGVSEGGPEPRPSGSKTRIDDNRNVGAQPRGLQPLDGGALRRHPQLK